MTGHTEVVLVVFDPKIDHVRGSAEDVLGEPRSDAGDATGQRRRHAVSVRHLVLRRRAAQRGRSIARCVPAGAASGRATAPITTEILPAPEFYYAEDYHQQYLAKNPGGYCGLGGTGVSCPIGVARAESADRESSVEPLTLRSVVDALPIDPHVDEIADALTRRPCGRSWWRSPARERRPACRPPCSRRDRCSCCSRDAPPPAPSRSASPTNAAGPSAARSAGRFASNGVSAPTPACSLPPRAF